MGLFRKFRALFQTSRVDAEIYEELRFHIEMRENANPGAGMRAEDARLDARRRLGNLTLFKERTRDVDLLVFLETAIQIFVSV